MGINQTIKVSIRLILVGIVLFAIIYPFLVGGIGQIWPVAVRGSVVVYEGEEIGSTLIGQKFTSPKYFYSRPSSIDYDARNSGSANLASNNYLLRERVNNDLNNWNNLNIVNNNTIPADIITESGSALDPHISPDSAYMQVPRISEVTGISKNELNELIKKNTQNKLLGVFGMKRVNVLRLNLAIKEVLD